MNTYYRYTQRKFPPYRFVPGENPHPTESPLGHSYGKKEREIEILVPDNWRTTEPYLYGIDLYNYGYWWESHEAWESLWRGASGREVSRDYLQGLIKISAAFLKWHLRQSTGLSNLYIGAVQHLLKVLKEYPVYMGLNIADHLEKLEQHFRPVLKEGQWPDPLRSYPYIVLTLLEEKQDLRYILRAEYEGYGMISSGCRGA